MSLLRKLFEILECRDLEILKDIQGGSSRNPEWTEGSLQEGTLDYLKKVHGNDYERRIILVGKTGNGKSSTGNTLLGRTHFDETLSSYDEAYDLESSCKGNWSARSEKLSEIEEELNPYMFNTELFQDMTKKSQAREDGYETDRSSRVNSFWNGIRRYTSLVHRSIERSSEETLSTNARSVKLPTIEEELDPYFFYTELFQDMTKKSQAREDGYETDRSSRMNNVWNFIPRNTSLVHRLMERSSEETLSTNDSYVQKHRVLKNSLTVFDTVLGTDSLADLFCKSEIVTYGEMYKGWRSNKVFEYVKDMDSGSYDAFNSCLVQSVNEYLVHCLEEQQAELERMIMSETEKRQKSVKEKESVSNRWQEFLTEVFRRTVDSDSNLRARKQESEINRSCLLKLLEYVCWNEDLNTSFLSDNNGKDLGEFTLQSDKEIGVSMHTDNVPVKVGPIADGSYEMQADETFRELEQMLMCKVCLDADLCILFLPCRHMATCESCARELQSCPVCRSTIQDSVKLNYE